MPATSSQRPATFVDSHQRILLQRWVRVFLCIAMGLFGTIASAQETSVKSDAAELVKQLPSAVNNIAIIRVAEIMNSQRAADEEWEKTAREKFMHGAASIPPWVETLVMGSLTQPGTPNHTWTAGLFIAPTNISLKQISRQDRAPIEKIAGQSAVRGLNGSYLVRIQPGQFAFVTPAFRQITARWVRALEKPDKPEVSKYLQQAASSDGQIVIALDMQDMIDPLRVTEHVSVMPQFAEKKTLAKSIGNLFGDAVGMTLACNIGSETTASLQISFSRDIKMPAEDLKSIFMDILNRSGLALEELADATYSVEGPDFIVMTSLSDASLRQLMTLIITPQLSHQHPAQMATSSADAENKINKESSRYYYLAVEEAIDDLSRKNRKKASYEQTVRWHETYANKLAEMSTVGVDPDLVNYSNKINRNFRALAASLRGQAVEIDSQEQSVTWNYEYDPGYATVGLGWPYGGGWGGGWGGWGSVGGKPASWKTTSNLEEVREKQAEAVAAGAKQREEIWLFIEDERHDMASTMRERYGAEFILPRNRKR